MSSRLALEIAETAQVIERQITANNLLVSQLAAQLRAQPPALIMMIGRGTSDHAGVFAKYLFEVSAGIPVAAAAPSVASLYQRQLHLSGALVMVISQSGRSPDIVEQAAQAKRAGAVVVAIVNAEDAPLCAHADWVIAMHAGSEQAVAASKSYLASLTVLLHIAAQWQQDTELLTALQQFPHYLEAHAQPPLLVQPSALQDLQHCIVLGRGFGYAIAREVALKLKEVLGLHAEAFSSAEFLHGPITLIRHPLTIIDLTIGDESAAAHQQQMREIAARGAQIIPWHSDTAIHPRLQPLELMWRFYQALEHMARSRGLNPDAPPGLKKITETY